MKIFGQIVRTLVNVVELPVEIVKDAVTLAGTVTGRDKSYTREQLEKIKDEAEEP